VAGFFAAFMHNNAALARQASSIVTTQAGYQRRQEDWDLQKKLADLEPKHIDQTISGLQIRAQIAKRQNSTDSHDLQRKNATEIDDFMKSKLAGADLYGWASGQVSGPLLPRATPQRYDLAKKAEATYRYELGSALRHDTAYPLRVLGFSPEGATGSGRDMLFHDLKRMEMKLPRA